MTRPRFSKAHYEFVAELLHRIASGAPVEEVSKEFAARFSADNPRFDYERWNHAVRTGEMFPRKTTKRAREVFS